MNAALSRFFSFLLLMLSLSMPSAGRDVKVPLLTEHAKVSLLTINRNDEAIYRYFGHTAIRVKDTILGWDLVYNYGTFDFYQPGFVMNFIRGKLLYYESIDQYGDFEVMYREENRWIREQELNLTQEQKQSLFEKLTINAREENKYYQYDFLFDNCSTRPRDVILSLFKEKQFQSDADDAATFRELIDRNVPNEWIDFGMDLLIGLPTDRKAGYDRTFLPLELMELFDHATVDGKPLVKGNELILSDVPEHYSSGWWTPGVVFTLLGILIIVLQIKTGVFSRYKVIPLIYLSLVGLIGWLLVFMWFGTYHPSTKWNLNLLWALPFHVPVLLFALRKNVAGWVYAYIKGYRILLVVLLVGWWLNPQDYHAAVVPLLFINIFMISVFLPVPTKEDFSKRIFG